MEDPNWNSKGARKIVSGKAPKGLTLDEPLAGKGRENESKLGVGNKWF
jgi:hypothetical protein